MFTVIKRKGEISLQKRKKKTLAANLTPTFTDDGLGVVTGDVVPFDTVSVEVIEDSQAVLIPFPVVRLWSAISSSARPIEAAEASTVEPPPA